MDPPELSSILKKITSDFKIVWIDFNAHSDFLPYLQRKIGGLVRFDENTIYIHSKLSPTEKELTFLHEILSIYYYEKEIPRHDEEIERETIELYQRPEIKSLVANFIGKIKG